MIHLFRIYRDSSLILRITLALLAGIALGLAWPAGATAIAPLGDLLLRLLKFLIVPIVMLSIIVGVNQSHHNDLGRTGGALIAYYLITTAMAMCIGLLVAGMASPGSGMSLDAAGHVDVPDNPGLWQVVLGIVPKNIVGAMADLNLLGLIFTALVFGLAIAQLRSREQTAGPAAALYRGIEGLNDATMLIMRAVLHYVPIGILAIVAHTVAQQGSQALTSLAAMIGVLYVALLLQLLFYTGLLAAARAGAWRFWRAARVPMATAFATQSSAGTLPLTLDAADRLSLSRRVSGFALPLGATVNMDGAAIRIAVSAVFAANIIGVSLSWTQLGSIVLVGTLASIGTAGIPGAGIVMIATVFAQVGLPIETVALLTSIDALVGMGCTAVNVTGDLVGATLINRFVSTADDAPSDPT